MKKKKVALIGNMNNNHFTLLRYLLLQNIEAHLFLYSDEIEHFLPENDTYDLDLYQNNIHELNWNKLPSKIITCKTLEINQLIQEFDFIIGSGPAPAYFERVKKELDIFVPHGDDLFELPFFKISWNYGLRHNIKYLIRSRLQRAGIKKAKFIWLDDVNEELEKVYNLLKSNSKRIKRPFLFTFQNEYTSRNFFNYSSKWIVLVKKLKDENNILAFSHCRQSWACSRIDFHQKGNDVLIRGFSQAVKLHKNIILILLEYGPDVQMSKNLINELGIEDNILWLPKLPRKEIMKIIETIDVGFGEIGLGWNSYGVIMEFLALGKPFAHHRKDENNYNSSLNNYPMTNIRNQEEVTDFLSSFVEKRTHYQEQGLLGKDWYMTQINKVINEIVEIIDAKKQE